MTMMPAYRQADLPIDARLDDLLARMTLDEKIAQVRAVYLPLFDNGMELPAGYESEHLAHGIGEISRIAGASLLEPAEAARLADRLQTYLVERTRLGIPAIIHEECLHGVLAAKATVFPQAIGLACTWDPAPVQAMANELRRQLRAIGASQGLAPVLDICREPRWGRLEETFGEDPYLASQFAIAYVRGLQGDDLREGVLATAKHFVGYGMPESGRNCAPPHLGPRELTDVHLVPFAAAIREAGLAGIMPSYNDLDGVPCTGSRELLAEVLRGRLGFDGIVVADYCAINNLHEFHQVAATQADAALMALEAGVDVDLNHGTYYGSHLAGLVRNGRLDEAVLDASVRRVLAVKFRLGLFERWHVPHAAVAEVFDNPEQRRLARDLARKSVVLLKNDGDLLPLAQGRRIAVIGPNADHARAMFGDYCHLAHAEAGMRFSSRHAELEREYTRERLWRDGVPAASVLEALRTAMPQSDIIHARGCDHQGQDRGGFAEAVRVAQSSDVVVMILGGVSGFCGDYTSGEGCDRADIGLPGVQLDLLQEIHRTGRPIIVVIIDGRPLTLTWLHQHIPAILMAWLPGEEGGGAIADILSGKASPAGRLAVTMPRNVGQLPVHYATKPTVYNELRSAAENLAFQPLYPFGHGMSYTTFAYRDLRMDRTSAAVGDTVAISLEVENTGSRDGEEVVQLYVRDVAASVTRPVRQLAGFVRLPLARGERRVVTFGLPVALLGFTRADMTFGIEPGTIRVMVGASSDDIRLTGAFAISGPPRAMHGERAFSCPIVIA